MESQGGSFGLFLGRHGGDATAGKREALRRSAPPYDPVSYSGVMGSSERENGTVSFGIYDFDPHTLELRREGRLVRLQPQPARVLALLASRAGELVSREELQKHIWGDTHVDAEAGLNVCIREIRSALRDRPETPIFLQTVRGSGYRFIASVKAAAAQQRPRQPWRSVARWALVGSVPLAVVALSIGLNRAYRAAPSPPGPGQSSLSGAAPAEARWASSEAYESYLEGRYLVAQPDQQSLQRGIERLRKAISLEPESALGYRELGNALFKLNASPHEVMPQVRAAFERALALEPSDPEVHQGLASVELFYDWKPAAALSRLQQARSLGPATAELELQEALTLVLADRPQEALPRLEAAVELDPVTVRLRGDIGWLFIMLGNHEKAVFHCRRAVELDPEHIGSVGCLISAHRALGNEDSAAEFARTLMILRAAPPSLLATLDGQSPAAVLDRYDRWQLDRLLAKRPFEYVRSCALGVLYANVGATEESLDHLERAYSERSSFLLFLERSSSMAPLREEPRFQELVRRMREATG